MEPKEAHAYDSPLECETRILQGGNTIDRLIADRLIASIWRTLSSTYSTKSLLEEFYSQRQS
ncbi:hypothetical protein S7335_5366 [Synechococcus sp. PCC 7335]|nr:hypothetical protein S7335_5366 [Synechococcus sp. PCC 7335]